MFKVSKIYILFIMLLLFRYCYDVTLLLVISLTYGTFPLLCIIVIYCNDYHKFVFLPPASKV